MISAEAYLILQDQLAQMKEKNVELVHDNRLLVKQINQLRGVIEHYFHKDAKQKKMNQMHQQQLLFQEKKTNVIVQKIAESEKNQKQLVQGKFKSIMKDVFYKKMEKTEKQFEAKKKECEELLEFKEKVNRLYVSWQSKTKNPNPQELYKWVYNQVTKAKTISKPKSVNKRRNNDKNTTFSSSKEEMRKVMPFSQI